MSEKKAEIKTKILNLPPVVCALDRAGDGMVAAYPATNNAPGQVKSRSSELGITPDLAEDWVWAQEQCEHFGLNDYRGKHVTIYNKTTVDSGVDCERMRREFSFRFAVNPE